MTVVTYIKWWYCTYRPIALTHSFVLLFFRTLILYDIFVEHSFLFLFGRPVSEQ